VDELEIVHRYQVTKTYKGFYTGWSVTIDPRNMVYSYDATRKTFRFTNGKSKTWISVALEGANVHAARLVRAWEPSVFTTEGHPKTGEQNIEGDKPVAVFFSTLTPSFSRTKRLKIVYRIRFGKITDTTNPAEQGKSSVRGEPRR